MLSGKLSIEPKKFNKNIVWGEIYYALSGGSNTKLNSKNIQRVNQGDTVTVLGPVLAVAPVLIPENMQFPDTCPIT